MFFVEELLKFDGITVENYQIEVDKVVLRLGYFKDKSSCPCCKSETEEINQIRSLKVRDISILGKITILEIGRRQFYCKDCQKYGSLGIGVINLSYALQGRTQSLVST